MFVTYPSDWPVSSRGRGASGQGHGSGQVTADFHRRLGPCRAETPWGKIEDAPQSDDLPEVIVIPPADGDDHLWILTGDKDNPVRWEPIGDSTSS